MSDSGFAILVDECREGFFIKKPLTLLVGIIVSIIALSVIFPSDPQKPDLVSIIRNKIQRPDKQAEALKNNKISNLLRVDDSGFALTWSPDEKYLYYIKENNSVKGGAFEELWFSDIHGNKYKINSKFKFYSTKDAKWSPDGTMLCFISSLEQNKSRLFMYDTGNNIIKDITPDNVQDVGVTSYNWDDESLFLIMSIDIIKPRIDLYNIRANKYSRLDIELLSCKNVAFIKGNNIIFSNRDENFKYKIFTAGKSGGNVNYLTDGQEFLLSPDREKLVILSDIDIQKGLWIYDINSGKKKTLSNWPVYNAYWLSDSESLLFSMEEDCKIKSTYKGTIYKHDKDLKVSEITGAVHTIFVSSKSGGRIAMTSPDYMEDIKENKGIFIGQVFK